MNPVANGYTNTAGHVKFACHQQKPHALKTSGAILGKNTGKGKWLGNKVLAYLTEFYHATNPQVSTPKNIWCWIGLKNKVPKNINNNKYCAPISSSWEGSFWTFFRDWSGGHPIWSICSWEATTLQRIQLAQTTPERMIISWWQQSQVGGFSPTPLKNDGVKVSWGYSSQLNGKIKAMFQTTNQLISAYKC